jgi:hypothetical protein
MRGQKSRRIAEDQGFVPGDAGLAAVGVLRARVPN